MVYHGAPAALLRLHTMSIPRRCWETELEDLQHGRPPPPLPKLTAHGLASPQGDGDGDWAFALLTSNIPWLSIGKFAP